MRNKFFSVHSHFYQPPRLNPWTSLIAREENAFPYKNFNQKITDECYGPLSLKNTKISKDLILSLYSLINFDFGPTLFSYLEEKDPLLISAIKEADIISKKFYGMGNAIAQVYNHRIMPFCSNKDKNLQIKWGLEFFKYHFKRDSLGLWLSETAIDEETLEAVAFNGVKFIILSPHQAKTKIDVRKPYKWISKKDKSKILIIFFYDRDLSEKSFTELENTEKFYLRLSSSYSLDKNQELILLASDGENYGHHIKNGNLYLSSLYEKIISNKKITNINLSSYIYESFIEDIEILENTSWSCPHGLGRWSKNCGCRINSKLKDQNWREVLKESTDKLALKLDTLFNEKAYFFFKDPQKVLENYIFCILNSKPNFTLNFIKENSYKNLNPNEIKEALILLEMQKNSQLMRTSCAWFFDDISGIESTYSIMYAIRAIELAEKFNINLKEELENFKKAKSNFKQFNTSTYIENLKRENQYPENIVLEKALFHFFSYGLDFDNTLNYETKIINEKKENQELFINILINEKNTLIQKNYFINIKKENENIFFKHKESKPENFEEEIKNLKSNIDSFTISDLSIFNNEKRNFLNYFLKDDERNKAIHNFLIFIWENGLNDYEKIFDNIKKILNNNIKLEEVPFIYEILILLILNENKIEGEIIKFIDSSNFKKLLWRKESLKEKII